MWDDVSPHLLCKTNKQLRYHTVFTSLLDPFQIEQHQPCRATNMKEHQQSAYDPRMSYAQP